MTNSKLVVAALAALSLTAGNAFAQDEGDPCGDPCAGDPCAGDPCGDGTGDGSSATGTGDDGSGDMDVAEGIEGYPQAVIDRPRVLPKGVLEATVNLEMLNISDFIGVQIGGRFGIAPKIDAQLTYGFALKEFEIKGALGLVAQFSLSESDKLGVAARVSTGFDVLGEEFAGVGVGLNLQYKVTPKIAVFTNGDHLTLGGADFPKPVALHLPFGVRFQVDDKISTFLETSIATIGISPSENATFIIGADVTPLQVGGTFSPSNKLDVGLSFFTPNLEDTADFYSLIVHAALRM